MEMDWSESIRLMEVYAMLCKCTYCVFTVWGRFRSRILPVVKYLHFGTIGKQMEGIIADMCNRIVVNMTIKTNFQIELIKDLTTGCPRLISIVFHENIKNISQQ